MYGKVGDIVKAIFFTAVLIFCVTIKIKEPSALWPIVGGVISLIAAVGFFKRAFDKY